MSGPTRSLAIVAAAAAACVAGALMVWWRSGEGAAPARPLVPLPEDWSQVPAPLRRIVEPAAAACRAAPRDAAAFAALGRIYHGNRQLALAGACYRIALDLGSDEAPILYMLGLVHEAEGDAERAAQNFAQALERQPGYAPAWYRLGRARLDQARIDEAIVALREAVRLEGIDATYGTFLGEALRQAGRLEAAEEVLRAALTHVPDHRAAHQVLGLVLQAQGRHDEARPHLARAGGRRATRGEVVNDPWLLEAQRHAVALEVMLDVAEDLLEAGAADSAARQLGQCVRLYPDSAKAHRLLGRAHLQARRPQEAIDAWLHAARLDPADALARAALAGILLDHDRLEDARHEMELALAADPACADALAVQGALDVRRGDAAAALEILRPLVRRRPDVVAAQFWLGEALVAQGDLIGAATAFTAAVEQEPRFEFARRRLAEVERLMEGADDP